MCGTNICSSFPVSGFMCSKPRWSMSGNLTSKGFSRSCSCSRSPSLQTPQSRGPCNKYPCHAGPRASARRPSRPWPPARPRARGRSPPGPPPPPPRGARPPLPGRRRGGHTCRTATSPPPSGSGRAHTMPGGAGARGLCRSEQHGRGWSWRGV